MGHSQVKILRAEMPVALQEKAIKKIASCIQEKLIEKVSSLFALSPLPLPK